MLKYLEQAKTAHPVSGIQIDVKLAKATENIDLIIGGHTHTFLKKPTIEINKAGKKVLINQVGCYDLYLGRIDFYLDNENNFEGDGLKIEV